MLVPTSDGNVLVFDRLLVPVSLLLKPDLVGVPGLLDAGVVVFDEPAAFFR